MHYDGLLPLLFLIGTGVWLCTLYHLHKHDRYFNGDGGTFTIIKIVIGIIWVMIFFSLCYLTGCVGEPSNLPDSQTSSYTETNQGE